MEFFASNEFGRVFYIVGASLVIFVVWQGYYRNRFYPWFAYTVCSGLVLFTIFYLSYRFGTGYTPAKIEEETARHAYYAWWAALHGTLSFIAIIQTCVLFIRASRVHTLGKNYFREHPKLVLSLVILWPVAILFGMLI